MIQLETERLIIRDHLPEDKPSLRRLLTDLRTMRYLSEIHCKTDEEVDQNLAISIQEADSSQRSKYYFSIEKKPALQYIGEIGFTLIQPDCYSGIANLGYFILPEYWNNSYTTEAARMVIDFAFQSLPCHKITSSCLKENKASERVMQKCGMIKEAEFVKHVFHENSWKDRVQYRLLREDWELCRKREIPHAIKPLE